MGRPMNADHKEAYLERTSDFSTRIEPTLKPTSGNGPQPELIQIFWPHFDFEIGTVNLLTVLIIIGLRWVYI